MVFGEDGAFHPLWEQLPQRQGVHTGVWVWMCGGGGGVCVGVQRGSSSLVLFHDDVISCMCNVVVRCSNWRVDGTTVKVL